MDPIHQFTVEPFVPVHLFGLDVSFTNASLFMILVVALVSIVMLIGTSQRSIVPGRLQSAAEMSYEFVASTVRMTAGNEGMKFFPLIFTIFMFVLACNLLGLLPFSFSITSQIVITFALAIGIILVVIAVGVSRHGLHFLKLFVPSGVTIWLLPFIVVIEVISFLIRPVTLSVRLFANMLAGHITLKVMAGFVAALLGAGAATWIVAPLPFLANVVLLGFELFVAVLQAYIFTILSCVYLNDAIHPGH
ncbi:F0F1 ATP synthase subunit A [Methylovirgula ligni]|uniref:ATP synthase subunit a n=1 Tax=Methylovirgula ligni TaxID=569860 RepID=A0A3D9YY71_9HYPH|nr:F0F1 ATP synthase subunit A [Methylovirgula ligni]QAY94442.1 F0F1 ATP synthase subunit A [Methylovirgula ligni]REF87704.1 ATP synthase F0 subcomplex A subunit [Methylovirgula ligni]